MRVSMKLNPVYKNELKMNVRTIRTSFILLGYNAILMIIGLLTFYLVFGSNPSYNRGNYGEVLVLYCMIAILEVSMVLIVVPAITSGCITGERERQTLEILLTTTLSPRQIVWGKVASSMSLLLLLVISSLPIVSIVFSIGGIEYKDLFQMVFMVCVTSFYIGSIGIYFSTKLKKSISATIATYLAVLILCLGTIFFLVMKQQVIQVSGLRIGGGVEMAILLLNPIVSLLAMLSVQYGAGNTWGNFVSTLGSDSAIVNQLGGYWFGISVVIQLFVGCILLEIAARTLDPLNNKKKGLLH